MKINNRGLFKTMKDFEFIDDPLRNRPNLGIGSFGVVRLAKNRKDDRYYAIKIVNKNILLLGRYITIKRVTRDRVYLERN